MTREEAIKHFESYIGNECYTHSHQEACRLAVAALRAQPAKLDRSRWEGCEWCENTGAVIIEQHHAFRSKRKRGSAVAIYCPSCGKPLTEDAWAELERRIGGSDGTAD